MKLSNLEGSFVSIDIMGYQFPDNINDYWDSNWLMVQIYVKSPVHSWTVIVPCLTVMDLRNLTNWFLQVSQNIQTKNSPYFVENYILFTLVIDDLGNKCIRVDLNIHLPGRIELVNENLTLDFPFSEIDFSEVIEDLQNQLTKYPQRVFRNQK